MAGAEGRMYFWLEWAASQGGKRGKCMKLPHSRGEPEERRRRRTWEEGGSEDDGGDGDGDE